MKLGAHVENSEGKHEVALRTGAGVQTLVIPPKPSGFGSRVSGGELLFLALATCYCNDVYREAARRGVRVERVEVDVEGDFEAEGAPATNVTYQARVSAHASAEEIIDLMREVDRVAEIQNSLRVETPVELIGAEVQTL